MFYECGQDTEFGSRLHDIRHKFAINRLKDGCSIYRLHKYFGHETVLTTERYCLRYLTQEEQESIRKDSFNGL